MGYFRRCCCPVLLIALLLGVVACGGSSDSADQSNAADQSTIGDLQDLNTAKPDLNTQPDLNTPQDLDTAQDLNTLQPDLTTQPDLDPQPDLYSPLPDLIDADPPKPAEVNLVIDSSKNRLSISRFIYGLNHYKFDKSVPIPYTRLGGNRWTAYNWENNASNAGSDWNHQSDDYLGGGDTPGEAVRGKVKQAHDNNASIYVTVPIGEYLAADKNGGGDVNQTANYLQVRFKKNRLSKGSTLSLTPNLSDDFVYQDEFVNFLENAFPGSKTNPDTRIFYALDNEPALWSETHARIFAAPVTYAYLLERNIAAAKMIKSLAPHAMVFGPVLYGYGAYANLQSAPDSQPNGDFLDYYLKRMKQEQDGGGTRLVDALDLHWYPEARDTNNERITSQNTHQSIVAARLQAPRSLWDETYTETSWITSCCGLGPLRLIPRLKEKIDAHYPGTKISFSEYYYGAGEHISGGIAQADVLGIFGREGVFAANNWFLGDNSQSFVYGAFKMFLNYDGSNGRFGDTSISATTDDVEKSSVYASVDQADPNRMVLVLINKSNAPIKTSVTITHSVALKKARVYRLTSASPDPQVQPEIQITALNSFEVEMPPMSVSTLVLSP